MIHRRVLTACTAAALAAAAMFSPGPCFANDTCATASALALDAPVAGTNAGATDDYRLPGSSCFDGAGQMPTPATGADSVYTFVAPAGGHYSFRVTDHASSSDLVVYASTRCPGPALPATVTTCIGAGNRRSTGPAEEVYCIPLAESEMVWVYVDQAMEAPGSSFVLEANACRREVEPNDVPEEEVLEGQGAGLTCSDEGSIDPPGDVDFWALGALIADARVFTLIDGVSTDATDFDLRVTTALDTLEYDDLNNDVEYGANSPNVGGSPLDGEEAFLRVTYNDPLVPAEPYRLYTTIQPPLASASAESEPNNAPATADAAPNHYYRGTLPGPAPSSDVDFYAFEALAGELYHVGLDGDPLRDNTPINPRLELVAADGSTVLREINDGSAASSPCVGCVGTLEAETPFAPAEGLIYRIPADGTYYVRVSIGNVSPLPDGAGDYLLSIARDCEPSLDPAVDDDGDSVVNADDCAPLTPGVFHAPLEIENLRILGDKETVEWDSAVPGAGEDTVHDLLRGVLEDLPVSGVESEMCLLPDSPPTFVVDPDVPPLGGGFYYIVRGHNECGDGTFGFATSGEERVPEGPNGCP